MNFSYNGKDDIQYKNIHVRGRPIFAKKKKKRKSVVLGSGQVRFLKDIGVRLAHNAQHFRQASMRSTFVKFRCTYSTHNALQHYHSCIRSNFDIGGACIL